MVSHGVGRIKWQHGLLYGNYNTHVKECREQEDHCYYMNFGCCRVDLDDALSGW
jgi:hypothetical protein